MTKLGNKDTSKLLNFYNHNPKSAEAYAPLALFFKSYSKNNTKHSKI